MTTIETPYGNFGRFEDLLHFMKDEGLESIQMSVSYVFALVVPMMTFTRQDIEAILER